MATFTKVLIPRKQAEAIQTNQYVVDTGKKAVIDKFTATNTTSLVVEISVNISDTGVISDSNLIVDTRKIAAGETYTFPELIGQVIESGGVISTIAGTAASLTITASGREIVQ
jgi:hypothetical protein